MTIVKTHTGTVITKDGPKVKKTAPNRADVGRWQKTSFYHKETGRRHFAEKYAPPTAVRHHQAYRGEACLNRTKKLSLKLLIISRVRAGVCSCRKPKRALEKKIALYIDDGCDSAVLNAAFAPALNCHTRESFFRASQRNSTKEATSEQD